MITPGCHTWQYYHKVLKKQYTKQYALELHGNATMKKYFHTHSVNNDTPRQCQVGILKEGLRHKTYQKLVSKQKFTLDNKVIPKESI